MALLAAGLIRVQTRTQRRMRPYFCAPKFWPEKVVVAVPNAPIIIQKMPSILPLAVQAAMTFVPKPLMVDCTIILEML